MSTDSTETKTAEKKTAWYEECFELLETLINGERGTELHHLRAKAHSEFLKTGLPAPKQEEWKYTDLRDVRTGSFTLPKKSVVAQVDDTALTAKALTDLGSINVHSVDGFIATPLEQLRAELPEGVEVTTLRELFSEKSQDLLPLYEEYFGKIASAEEDSVVALNTSFVQDGILFRVKAGVTVEQPLYIQHLASGLHADTALFPRVLCVVEKNAKFSLVEHFTSLGEEAGFTSSVTELSVAENAEVDHYQVGEEGGEQIRVSRISANQARDSRARMHTFAFGGKLVRQEVCPTLGGENGFTGMYGLSVLDGEQHVDNHTTLDHAVPHCESDERYKGIYDDKSKGVFCGTIIVRPDAQKTNAIQNNSAVLLSDKATVNTKPQLKIWADDVKCTHGATVGQLDQDQLFYLRSRGVGQKDARNMLVRAFAGEVTQETAIEPLRSYIEEKVVEKLSL